MDRGEHQRGEAGAVTQGVGSLLGLGLRTLSWSMKKWVMCDAETEFQPKWYGSDYLRNSGFGSPGDYRYALRGRWAIPIANSGGYRFPVWPPCKYFRCK